MGLIGRKIAEKIPRGMKQLCRHVFLRKPLKDKRQVNFIIKNKNLLFSNAM